MNNTPRKTRIFGTEKVMTPKFLFLLNKYSPNRDKEIITKGYKFTRKNNK